MFFRIIEPYVALILLLATTAFAVSKGGKAERLGTAMISATWIGTLLLQGPAGHDAATFLVFDGVLAAGFLVVAVRYSSLWLGAAMILQAVSFGAHALRLSDSTSVVGNVYILVMNVVSFLILLVLIGGTVSTIRHRRRAEREKVEDRARLVRRPDWLTDGQQQTVDAL